MAFTSGRVAMHVRSPYPDSSDLLKSHRVDSLAREPDARRAAAASSPAVWWSNGKGDSSGPCGSGTGRRDAP